ncbi:hypothetical protein [Pedobacter steynii]
MSVAFYTYPIPNSHKIREIRTKIWNAINKHYDQYPVEIFGLLSSYARVNPDTLKEIMSFDVDFLIEIIDKHLSPESFEHCKYVNDQIRWLKRNEIVLPIFSQLKDKFTNPTYELFLKIDWDRFRDKEMFEFTDLPEV